MESMKTYREFLKAHLWKTWESLETDQRKKIPSPPVQKPYPEEAELIDLVEPKDFTVGNMPLIEAINRRRSRRKFTEESLTLEEFSFLLWTTQGVRKVIRQGVAAMRTVPSAGARHPFETYVLVNNVEGLAKGLYRFLASDHKLITINLDDDISDKITEGCYRQRFVKTCAVTFIFTADLYRMYWRYGERGYRYLHLDAGHVSQNLYLAAEAIGGGACAIGAFYDELLNRVLGIDGENQFTVYVTTTGKK